MVTIINHRDLVEKMVAFLKEKMEGNPGISKNAAVRALREKFSEHIPDTLIVKRAIDRAFLPARGANE